MNYSKLLINYNNLISSLIGKSDISNIETLYQAFDKRFLSNGRVFFAGNGGSAAIASHASTDLSKISKSKNKLSTICLNENISLLTATANDFGYENIFTEIIKNFKINDSDMLVTISSSGNSKNINNLIDYFNNNNIDTFSLTGFDGGVSKKNSKFNIHINSPKNYYGPIEDIHMMLFHIYVHLIKQDIEEIK